MTEPIPESEIILATMEAIAAASAKVLVSQFLFSERQLGMYVLLVQQELADHMGTDELQEELQRQIIEFDLI